jgi:hypothetical protein
VDTFARKSQAETEISFGHPTGKTLGLNRDYKEQCRPSCSLALQGLAWGPDLDRGNYIESFSASRPGWYWRGPLATRAGHATTLNAGFSVGLHADGLLRSERKRRPAVRDECPEGRDFWKVSKPLFVRSDCSRWARSASVFAGVRGEDARWRGEEQSAEIALSLSSKARDRLAISRLPGDRH